MWKLWMWDPVKFPEGSCNAPVTNSKKRKKLLNT